MATHETDSAVIPVPANEVTAPAVHGSNYAALRLNAMKHGILSRYTVLAHEDADEYQTLLSALLDEHQPAAMTEAHLVEELAGIIWRKRRVLQAEGASINRGLKGAVKDTEGLGPAAVPFEYWPQDEKIELRNLMPKTSKEIAANQRYAKRDLAATEKALEILDGGGKSAYGNALKVLHPDSRESWEQCVEDEEYTANTEGLTEYLRNSLMPYCEQAEKEARYHDAIKAQTLGESLQTHRLDKLTRYETHLDRKFERTLAMLVKLKQLRSAR